MKHIIFAVICFLAFFIANFGVYLMLSKISFLTRFTKHIKRIFVVVFLLEILFVVLMRKNFLNDEVYDFLAMLLGFSFFFFLVSMVFLFVDFILNARQNGLIKGIKQTLTPPNQINQSRRKFLKLSFEVWVLVVAFSMFFKGLKDALSIPKVNEISIQSDKITKDLKLAVISDLHLGKNLNEDFFKGVIKRVNELNADCVMIVGDLVDTDIDDINYLHLLNDFKSKYGTFYVFGNHEYYHGVENIHKELKKYNITILDNKNAFFDDFMVAGVNDLAGIKYGVSEYMPDLNKAKKSMDLNKFNILLTHQPKFAKLYDVNEFDLVLAGHTHAGQIFPFSILVVLEQGFLYGLYKLTNKTNLYVSSGAGFWGPSIRFLAPSEIALINITKENKNV